VVSNCLGNGAAAMTLSSNTVAVTGRRADSVTINATLTVTTSPLSYLVLNGDDVDALAAAIADSELR
jgi:hypothetical protein